MIRILHTGDWHLDSPFSHLDPHRAEVRRAELRDTVARIMAFAAEWPADLVLVAGDVFDRVYVTRETVSLLCRLFASVPCPVLLAPGNHDPDGDRSVWSRETFPDNVFVFHRETVEKRSFDHLSVDVYGYAFRSPELRSNPLAGVTVPDDGRIHLLLGHGDLTSPDSPYCPLSPAELERFGADYTALGHLHNPPRPLLSPDGRRGVAYAGCPEGRGPDERGPRGALLVEIGDDRRIRITPRRFSRRRYETVSVSLDGVRDRNEAEGRIREAVAAGGFGEDTLLTVRLTGRIAPGLLLRAADWEADGLGGGLFSLTVRDETVPETQNLAADPTVRGAFYRALAPREGEPDGSREAALRALALRYGLAALSGDNVAER